MPRRVPSVSQCYYDVYREALRYVQKHAEVNPSGFASLAAIVRQEELRVVDFRTKHQQQVEAIERDVGGDVAKSVFAKALKAPSLASIRECDARLRELEAIATEVKAASVGV